MALLKLSTQRNRVVFMTDTADHVSGKTGLTLTVTASKDGGSFASISPGVGELASGWYVMTLSTVHTNTLGDLALHITAAATDPSDLLDQVVNFLPGDNDATVTAALTVLTAASTTLTAAATVLQTNVGTLTAATTVITANVTTLTAAMTTVTAFGTTLTAAATLHTAGLSTLTAAATLLQTNVGTLTASSTTLTAASTVLTAASTVLTAAATTLTAAVTNITSHTNSIPGTPASTSDIPTTGSITKAVWDIAIAAHITAGTTGNKLNSAGAGATPPTAAEIADAVFDEAISGHTTDGTFGEFCYNRALTVSKFLGLEDGD